MGEWVAVASGKERMNGRIAVRDIYNVASALHLLTYSATNLLTRPAAAILVN